MCLSGNASANHCVCVCAFSVKCTCVYVGVYVCEREIGGQGPPQPDMTNNSMLITYCGHSTDVYMYVQVCKT